MKNKLKIIKNALIASLTFSSLFGCGSAGSSNDQGVSFTLYGMFQDSACSTGLSGAGVQLSTDPESNGSGVGVVAALGLQNNLAQGIRTRRAYLKYYVEGSDIQPPPTSQALGLFLGPGFKSPNSSLPDSFGGSASLPSSGCAQFELVPPEILSYLNLNRNKFPELPYKMRVEVSVSGIGTAGDEYTTNPLDVPLEVVQDNIIAPSPAETATAGSAGTDSTTQVIASDENTEVIPVIPGTDLPAA